MSDTKYWSSSTMSRRGLIRGAGVMGVGLSAAALIGCSGGSSTTTPAPTGGTGAASGPQPLVRKGTIRQGTGKLSEPYDPATMLSAGPTYWGLWGNLALKANKQNFKLEPSLVESWEVKSPTEIALKVRKGVFFHDKAPTNGRELNASDVAYSLNRHAALLDKEKAALYPRRTNFRFMTEAVATDANTVTLKMSAPNSAILNGMADMRTPIMPIESKDTGFNDPSKIVGTGPWMIKQMDNSGNGSLVPNPKYWEKDMPKAAEVTKQSFDTYQANTASFISDAIDYLIMTNQPWREVEAVQKSRSDAQVLKWDYGYIHYMRYNTQKPLFKDERLRRALTLVVDTKAIGEAFYGELAQPTGPLVATWTNEAIPASEIVKRPGWNPATKEADIAEGKKLMEAAGYKEGEITANLMVFNTPVHPANSERLRAQWLKIWPKIKITFEGPVDSGPFNQRLAANNFDMMAYSNLPTTDGAVEFQNFYASDGSRNYGKFSDPDVDKLANDALQEFDVQKRGKLIRDAQEIVIQKSPIIAYYYAKQVAFVSPKWDGYQGFPGPGGQSGSDLVEAARFVSQK